MKTLYVLRHAKTERDSESGRDFDRALTERGWRDAELVGRERWKRSVEAMARSKLDGSRAFTMRWSTG